MNIGITSSSDFNSYASSLVCKLTSQGEKPSCIICARSSAVRKLIYRAKKRGLVTTVRETFRQTASAPPQQSLADRFLKDYALSNRLADWNTPLKEIARKYNLGHVTTESINSREATDYVRRKAIDILINAGGGIFRSAMVNAPRLGILNAHMGYLPAFRGMNVLEWSLFYGQKIGVTVHFIDTGIDTGDILMFREIPVKAGDTIETLRAKSLPLSVELVCHCISQLKQGQIRRVPQRPEDGKQYYVMHPRLRSIAEGKIADYCSKTSAVPAQQPDQHSA